MIGIDGIKALQHWCKLRRFLPVKAAMTVCIRLVNGCVDVLLLGARFGAMLSTLSPYAGALCGLLCEDWTGALAAGAGVCAAAVAGVKAETSNMLRTSKPEEDSSQIALWRVLTGGTDGLLPSFTGLQIQSCAKSCFSEECTVATQQKLLDQCSCLLFLC